MTPTETQALKLFSLAFSREKPLQSEFADKEVREPLIRDRDVDVFQVDGVAEVLGGAMNVWFMGRRFPL